MTKNIRRGAEAFKQAMMDLGLMVTTRPAGFYCAGMQRYGARGLRRDGGQAAVAETTVKRIAAAHGFRVRFDRDALGRPEAFMARPRRDDA